MAKRPVFFVDKDNYFRQENVDFKWYPGFAKSQKLKSIHSLHQAFLKHHPKSKMLEISSASPNLIGVQTSAFNLKVRTTHGEYTVEQLFQAGKVFKEHGNQEELLRLSSNQARRQIKVINQNDQLVSFKGFKDYFPLEPKTYFYNWIYICGLHQHKDIAQKIAQYNAFTDIYFNPVKSFNCQAQSCSIYVSLLRRGLLDEALKNKRRFLEIVYGYTSQQAKNNKVQIPKHIQHNRQLGLFK